MRRPQVMFAAAAVCVAAWYFFQQYRIEGIDQLSLRQRDGHTEAPGADADEFGPPPIERSGGTIRVASFDVQAFGPAKLLKSRVINILADTVRKFDLVAVQELRARSDDLLPRFVDLVNSTGRHYEFVVGPRLGRGTDTEQYAFIFDSASIEIDRTALYTVRDPDDVLYREPLVAWFRVRGVPASQAFTFTLINCHTDPANVAAELDALANVYRAVRDDGRSEDDVILLGNLHADDQHLGRLGDLSNIMPVISGIPTNTRGDKHTDNMLFSKLATGEYTGRSGVFDLVREFNLTTEDALQVSDHLPIWAEFTVYEGGQGGRYAERPTQRE